MKWISVEDRLPKVRYSFSEKDVFCICPYSYEIGRTKNGKWIDMDNKPIDVLYWMHIPELPEELQDNTLPTKTAEPEIELDYPGDPDLAISCEPEIKKEDVN